MNRKTIMYIGILLIVSVIVSVTYFSYAYFTRKDEEHGKLNIVAGTLNYKIESDDLTNNSITLSSKTNKELVINVTSLNTIESKYELYYETDNNSVLVGYMEDTIDMPTGTINSGSTKTTKILIKNNTNANATITFSVKGGFIDKEFTVNGISITEQLSTCDYAVGYYWDFAYTGNVQTFKVPCDGTYQLEVWGAQGGSRGGYVGGEGGYSKGDYVTSENTNLYVVVGGAGNASTAVGYNGGGGGGSNTYGATGGGMTDIRTTTSINNQIIVAGGGGGANNRGGGYGDGNGGAGGGLTGGNGQSVNHTNGYGYGYGSGGTQTDGGKFVWSGGGGTAAGSYQTFQNTTVGGTRGQGGYGVSSQSGGGGGYYGGGGCTHGGGGGGSGYIGGVTNASTQVGGRTGHGFARITYIGT